MTTRPPDTHVRRTGGVNAVLVLLFLGLPLASFAMALTIHLRYPIEGERSLVILVVLTAVSVLTGGLTWRRARSDPQRWVRWAVFTGLVLAVVSALYAVRSGLDTPIAVLLAMVALLVPIGMASYAKRAVNQSGPGAYREP